MALLFSRPESWLLRYLLLELGPCFLNVSKSSDVIGSAWVTSGCIGIKDSMGRATYGIMDGKEIDS